MLAVANSRPEFSRVKVFPADQTPVNKFQTVRTALMENFDLYLTDRWTFAFSLLWIARVELVPNLFGNFQERHTDSGGSASCDTQPNCWALFTIATALFCHHPSSSFYFGCCSTFRCWNEHSECNLHPVWDSWNQYSGGCQCWQDNWEQVFARLPAGSQTGFCL